MGMLLSDTFQAQKMGPTDVVLRSPVWLSGHNPNQGRWIQEARQGLGHQRPSLPSPSTKKEQKKMNSACPFL